jgi:hypothetical protein
MLIKTTLGLFGLAIIAFLIWPSVLANYAWYSAVSFQEQNPAISVVPEKNITLTEPDTDYEYTNFASLHIPHFFEQSEVVLQNEGVLTVSDTKSNANILVTRAPDMLGMLMSHKDSSEENTQYLCAELSKIHTNDACKNDTTLLQTILLTSPDTANFFTSSKKKFDSSILLILKSVYIAKDTTEINFYSSQHTEGFILYSENGTAISAFDRNQTSYSIAAYNMTSEEVEALVAAIKTQSEGE